MPPTFHLVRHAQGYHNLAIANHAMHDPLLTPLGETQCAALQHSLPASTMAAITLVVASPIKRTLQTALLAFSPAIAANNLAVLALPELQEISRMPCDTGSPRAALERDPELARQPIDLRRVPAGWDSKAGAWAPTAAAVDARCRAARRWLRARPEAHIVVVTHGAVLHHLTGDWEGVARTQGTGWRNAEWRSYVFDDEAGGEDVDVEAEAPLVETAESRARRMGAGAPSAPSRAEQAVLRAATVRDWEAYGMLETVERRGKEEVVVVEEEALVVVREEGIREGVEGPRMDAMDSIESRKRKVVEGCSA